VGIEGDTLYGFTWSCHARSREPAPSCQGLHQVMPAEADVSRRSWRGPRVSGTIG
jgi:hypothetical protein